MIVGIIGLGLIGGSMAKAIGSNGLATEIIGADNNKQHIHEALNLNLIDKEASIEEICKKANLIILAIPVNSARQIAQTVLDKIQESGTLVDMGSTKNGICMQLENHPKRDQFVAAHPIAGTENTGPKAAIDNLFSDNVCIICEREKSSEVSLQKAVSMLTKIGMKLKYMTAPDHDKHMAYVSHLSHISSFTLGLTVLEIEKNEKNIFDLAGSGFESTVRLAKSSAEMWAPIFEQNAAYLSGALESYIKHLTAFKTLIDQDKALETKALMEQANEVRRILKGEQLN